MVIDRPTDASAARATITTPFVSAPDAVQPSFNPPPQVTSHYYQPMLSAHHPSVQPSGPTTSYPGYAPAPLAPSALPLHQPALGKRLASSHPSESPAKKKQSKWTADEDASIIELRGNGMKWEDISKQLPGRSAISCRLRFQNYLERRSEWDEEKKNKLARLYER